MIKKVCAIEFQGREATVTEMVEGWKMHVRLAAGAYDYFFLKSEGFEIQDVLDVFQIKAEEITKEVNNADSSNI